MQCSAVLSLITEIMYYALFSFLLNVLNILSTEIHVYENWSGIQTCPAPNISVLKAVWNPHISNNYNIWHNLPVDTRPLSCGQGQCWCWFPKIHHGRFHQPESRKEMKTVTTPVDKNNTVRMWWWWLRMSYDTYPVDHVQYKSKGPFNNTYHSNDCPWGRSMNTNTEQILSDVSVWQEQRDSTQVKKLVQTIFSTDENKQFNGFLSCFLFPMDTVWATKRRVLISE